MNTLTDTYTYPILAFSPLASSSISSGIKVSVSSVRLQSIKMLEQSYNLVESLLVPNRVSNQQTKQKMAYASQNVN